MVLIYKLKLRLQEVESLKPFFHLTSSFFGLTFHYKKALWDEIFLCTQHLQGFTYSDVLAMPTGERRYYLGLLIHKKQKEETEVTNLKNGKGEKTTRISGEALKSKLKSGEI